MWHKSWCEFGKKWENILENILEKRFIRVLGIITGFALFDLLFDLPMSLLTAFD